MTIPAPRTLVTGLVLLCGLLAGCQVNPVTGESQLRFISEARELSIGEQQYEPTMQIQGGEYKADPALTAYLQEVGQKLARVSDRPELPYEFSVLSSGVPNAWALPGGKIAFNRGLLLELENEAQLAAVMGHEIVHAAASHSVQQMQKGMLVNVGIAGLGIALSDELYTQLAIGGAALGAQLIMARYGREAELESDRFGIEYMAKAGYDPQQAVELQRIFLRLSEGRNQDWLSGLFASHPPSRERVEKNQAIVNEMGSGGRIGRERYQEMTAHIRKTAPAYDKAREARELARNGELDKALALVRDAQKIEPREAAFHDLEAQILKEKGEPGAALDSASKAVQLYPDMFAYRLTRGLLYESRGQWDRARADYQQSLQAVPTSLAHLGLGDSYQAQGNTAKAAEHYKVAAQAKGKVAEEARRKLEALDSGP